MAEQTSAPAVSAKDVQRLRQAASVGMMDAKAALTEAGGDFDRAFQLLRERGLAASAKRADRTASEGAVGTYLHRQAGRVTIGAMVELAAETDFVAKSEEFMAAADEIAKHVSWANPTWLRHEDVPEDRLEEERRVATVQAENEGKPEHVVPRIVEGKIQQFLRQNVLYEQEFVNPAIFEGSVGEMVTQLGTRMGENISVTRIARLAVGEG